jgi:DNA-directed RNA polymerase subunit RPC12/RpoP
VSSSATWLGFKAKLFDTVTTEYTCSTCSRTISVVEQSNATGARAGLVCNDPCVGTYTQTSPVRVNQIGEHTDMMGLPAAGESMGGLWLFCTYGRGVSTWAHEIAHHKHLEHAPGAGIYNLAQHDSAVSTSPPLNGFVAPNNGWDRVCMMGYTRKGANANDLDRGYFCGKCILKLRGWKIETGGVNANVPAGNVTGP